MKIKRIIVAAVIVLSSVGVGLIPAGGKDVSCCGSEGVWPSRAAAPYSSSAL